MSRILLAALMALLVLGWSSSAVLAGTASDTMEVTATVVTVCDLSASDVAFGQYIGQEVTGTSNWDVSCTTSQSPLSYTLYAGLHYANGTRNMERVGESDLLAYEFTGAALSFTTDAGGQAGGPTYWRIPAGQIVPAGDYADTVTVTVGF